MENKNTQEIPSSEQYGQKMSTVEFQMFFWNRIVPSLEKNRVGKTIEGIDILCYLKRLQGTLESHAQQNKKHSWIDELINNPESLTYLGFAFLNYLQTTTAENLVTVLGLDEDGRIPKKTIS